MLTMKERWFGLRTWATMLNTAGRGLRGSPGGKHNGREYPFLYMRSTNIGANQPNRGRD